MLAERQLGSRIVRSFPLFLKPVNADLRNVLVLKIKLKAGRSHIGRFRGGSVFSGEQGARTAVASGGVGGRRGTAGQDSIGGYKEASRKWLPTLSHLQARELV